MSAAEVILAMLIAPLFVVAILAIVAVVFKGIGRM